MKKSVIVCLVFVISIICNKVLLAQGTKDYIVFEKSIDQEKKYDYAGAIETIQSLNDSTSYEANLRLGWLFYKVGYRDKSEFLYKKSMSYYNKAIAIMPKAIEPRYGFGLPAYLMEDHTELINQDKKILEIDPNNKTINGNLGAIYYYKKEYENALPYLEKLVSLYPFDYDNNLLLAWSYARLGKLAEAEQYFNVVLLYNPNDASALEGIGLTEKKTPNPQTHLNAFIKNYELAEKADYKGAIAALKAVYEPSNYILNLRLAWLHNLAGMQTESYNYYKIATEIKPNAIEPKIGCALAAEAAANIINARAQYEAVLAIDNQNTYAHYKLGTLDYNHKKDYQAALIHFEKIVTLYPCNADALLMMGWVYYQLNKTTESRAYFSKTLCVSPDNTSALQGLTLKPLDQMPKKHTGF